MYSYKYNNISDAGAVYIFSKPTATKRWSFMSKLIGNNTKTFDGFGHSVSVDNNEFVVGAPRATGLLHWSL